MNEWLPDGEYWRVAGDMVEGPGPEGLGFGPEPRVPAPGVITEQLYFNVTGSSVVEQ